MTSVKRHAKGKEPLDIQAAYSRVLAQIRARRSLAREESSGELIPPSAPAEPEVEEYDLSAPVLVYRP
jgi:hypothetical protein